MKIKEIGTIQLILKMKTKADENMSYSKEVKTILTRS